MTDLQEVLAEFQPEPGDIPGIGYIDASDAQDAFRKFAS